MGREDQHRKADRAKMLLAYGFLGATKDDYLTSQRYSCGADPYRMASLNPDFVRLPKAEDDEIDESRSTLARGEYLTSAGIMEDGKSPFKAKRLQQRKMSYTDP